MAFGKKLQKLGSARRSIRSVARASEPFDANAIDGDNDGVVQEGTTFERPATPRIPSTLTGDKGPKSVPRKGPYSDRPIGAPKRRDKKVKKKPAETLIDKAVGDRRAAINANVLGQRVSMQRSMTKQEIADVRNRLVGLSISSNLKRDSKVFPFLSFGPNSDADTYPIFDGIKFKDSILNTFSPRVREIVDSHPGLNYKELEAKYGKLDTLLDLQEAIKKAYPNTSGGRISINFPITQQMFNGRLDTPMKTEMFFDEIDPSMAAVRFEMLKMLQWGDQNPRTASAFSNLEIGNQNPHVKYFNVGTQSGHMGRPVAMAVSPMSGEYIWNENLFNVDFDTDATTYLVSVALGTIMANYADKEKPLDNQGRPWNIGDHNPRELPSNSIQGLLAKIEATHEHEFGHAHWFSGLARGTGNDVQSMTAFGETRETVSSAIAAARKQYADLGIDDPDELIRQLIISGWKEMALNIKDLENRQRISPGLWDADSWLADAKKLEDATDPNEIRSLSAEMLERMKSYGMQPGFLLFAPMSGRGLYSSRPAQGLGFAPMNTMTLQINDNPFNMPAFMLYRMFEKADIDISLPETRQLLKEALKFISERSQYGSVSVAEAFAELYSFKALGFLKESDGAPWRLLQLFEDSFEAIGGKSLAMLADIHAKGLNKIRNIRKARKVRRIVEPFDANAIDADNDGMVQDGTVNERPALANTANAVIEDVRANRPVKKKKKTGRDKRVQIQPLQPGTGKSTSADVIDKVRMKKRIKKYGPAIEFADDLPSDEKMKAIEKIKTMTTGNGINSKRVWNKELKGEPTEVSGIFSKDEILDSPFSIFSSRIPKVHKEHSKTDTALVEKEFGKIESIQDLNDALMKAFPNLGQFQFEFFIDKSQLDGIDETSATGKAIQNELIDEIDTQMLTAYTHGMALLEWSLGNPESAKNVEIIDFGNRSEEDALGYFGGKKLNLSHQLIMREANNLNSGNSKGGIGALIAYNLKRKNQAKNTEKITPAVLVNRADLLVDHESFHITHDSIVYRVFGGSYPLDIIDRAGAARDQNPSKFKEKYIELLKDQGIEDPESVYNFSLAGSAADIAASLRTRTGQLPQAVKSDARKIADELDELSSKLFSANSNIEQNQISEQLSQILVDNDIWFASAIIAPLRGDTPLTFIQLNEETGLIERGGKLYGPNMVQEQKYSGAIMGAPIKKLLESTDLDPSKIDQLIAAAANWMKTSETNYGNSMWAEMLAELFTAYKGGILKEGDGDAFLLIQYMLKALELTGGKSLQSSIFGLKIKVVSNG